MSDERDDLFEQEAEFEAIFKNLREKYNLDKEPKEEEKPKEFYNPEKDTEISEFFEEKSKNANDKADEFMDDEDDFPAKVEEVPVDDLKVEDFDASAISEPAKDSKEQDDSDFEWDEDTVLDFSIANKKGKSETPMVFEDISSSKTPEEIEKDNQRYLEESRANKISGLSEGEQIAKAVSEATQAINEDDPAGVILPEYNDIGKQPYDGPFSIKTDNIEELDGQDEEFDFVSDDEDPTVRAQDNSGIVKEMSYDNINWDDFPTDKEQKKELRRQKREEKRKKRRGIFPRKGDSAGEVIRKIVLIISVLAIIGSSAWLANDLILQPSLADKLYSEILENIVPTQNNRRITSFDDMTAEERALASKELLAQNGDYIGWLTVKGADVSLPVVMAGSNQKYLHMGFDGKWLNAGTLFVSSSNKSVLDKNVVIYGHNMNNGSMFGLLRKYKESDGSIYRDYPYITFHTIEGSFKYQIFGAFLADGAGKSDGYFVNTAIKPDFTEEAFTNYLTRVKNKSYYPTSVEVGSEDKILTLVTCDRTNLKTGRLVVVAKLIEEL